LYYSPTGGDLGALYNYPGAGSSPRYREGAQSVV